MSESRDFAAGDEVITRQGRGIVTEVNAITIMVELTERPTWGNGQHQVMRFAKAGCACVGAIQ